MGEVIVQSHKVGLTSYRLTSLSFHVNLASHYWVKDFFKIWPWNSRVKVMGEVTVQSHNVGLTSYRLTSLSFHVNRPSHSWHTAFSKFDLENQGQGHGWGNNSKSQCGSNILSTHIPFVPCQSALPFLSYDFFQNLTLKFEGQGYGWGHSSKSQCGSNILSTHIPFVPCQLALPFLKYSIFKIWPWKSRVKVKWPWCCTTIGLVNSIELRMV